MQVGIVKGSRFIVHNPIKLLHSKIALELNKTLIHNQ